MAVNKNFVVKNGIEVATDLIFASSDLDKVGIGSTLPTATLEVGGDAKVTWNSTIVGIATFSNNIDANGNLDVDGHTELDDLNVSGVSTFVSAIDANGSLDVDGHTELDDLNVSGVSTFASNLDINASIDVAGIATITGLLDANGGLEANTAKIEDLTDNRIVISGTGGELEDDANLTFDGTKLNVGSAVSIYASSGIVSATAFYGDGSNLSGVTATSGGSLGFSTSGSVGYGITLLNFVGAGVSDLTTPVAGIATLTIVGGGGGSASIGIGTTVGDAFSGIVTTGNLWYNTNEARLFIYYDDGTSSQWVDAAPFNIGIITSSLGSLNQGTALAPPLAFSGDSSTGLFSPTSGQQTFVSVGSSILNINPSGIEVTGVSSVGSAITMYGNTGVVSATSFYGDGSNLSGITAGATLSAGSGDQRVVLTSLTSGTMTSAATDAELTYNSDTDTLNVGNVSIAGTLTYEDVTNVDSIGVITARSGINVTGDANFDSGTLYVDSVNNGIGIGTTAPSLPGAIVADIRGSIRIGSDTSRQITIGGGSNGSISQQSGSIRIYGGGTSGSEVGILNNSIIYLKPNTGGVELYYGKTDKKLETSNEGVNVSGIVTAISGIVTYYGDGSQLSGISAGGITTTASSPSANTTVTLDLSAAQHHDLTLSAGITTITCTGGNFGESHSVVITQPSSGIATIGFSTYFLFPSGSTPSMSEGGGSIDLISFVVKRVGTAGTQLLASAGLNYQ